LAAALPHYDNDLTFAILIASEKTAVDATFSQVGWLHVAAKIFAINLSLFAFSRR
jgi:hypothetical protein